MNSNLTITKILTDSDSSTWITYIGEATYNSDVSLTTAKWLAIWKIQKVVETALSATNKISEEFYPVDTNSRASNKSIFIWNDRAWYIYK